MNIRFRAKNFSLTDGAKAAIDTKLTAIWGMFHEDTVFDVYIVKREKDYKCEIKVQRGKDFIRSEELGRTIEYSVDNAINTLKKRYNLFDYTSYLTFASIYVILSIDCNACLIVALSNGLGLQEFPFLRLFFLFI